jgi:hypothetical protein
MERVPINLRDHRTDPMARNWDLPPWGHPLSWCVLPLFIQGGGRLYPIGTAFWIGPKVQLVITAMHNVEAARDHEPRLERILAAGDFPSAMELKHAGFSVLHPGDLTGTGGTFTITPIRSIDGGPPGDVAFGHPEFVAGRPILSLPLSFDPPRIGEVVWSVGYTDFEPRDGIPLKAAMEGAFDWAREYRHRFVVAEGRVQHIFTQRFDRGYNRGPCFSFDNGIAHGQSGGPVISESGRIVGINSCDVSLRYPEPTSLSSMFYPLLLMNIHAGMTLGGGNFNLNMRWARSLFDFTTNGEISSDGSEKHVAVHQSEDGDGYAIGPRISIEDRGSVYSDFQGYQEGRTAEPIQGTVYGLRR